MDALHGSACRGDHGVEVRGNPALELDHVPGILSRERSRLGGTHGKSETAEQVLSFHHVSLRDLGTEADSASSEE
jgi:hypothetical protein